jgi:hypothetical protein
LTVSPDLPDLLSLKVTPDGAAARQIAIVSVGVEPSDNALIALHHAQMARQISLAPESFDSLRDLEMVTAPGHCGNAGL